MILFHTVLKRGTGDIQQPGRSVFTADHPVALNQGLNDGLPFGIRKGLDRFFVVHVRLRYLEHALNLLRAYLFTRLENDHPFDKILQFPDISGPVISVQQIERGTGIHRLRLVKLSRNFFSDLFNQQGNLFGPVPEGRDMDLNDVEPIVQIVSQPSR